MTQTATDQKYALLFHITPFQLGNLGKFDVWTLSLPLMVTVHGSQDCDAQGVILWQRAFSSVVGFILEKLGKIYKFIYVYKIYVLRTNDFLKF